MYTIRSYGTTLEDIEFMLQSPYWHYGPVIIGSVLYTNSSTTDIAPDGYYANRCPGNPSEIRYFHVLGGEVVQIVVCP